jgi:hypothetical protein
MNTKEFKPALLFLMFFLCGCSTPQQETVLIRDRGEWKKKEEDQKNEPFFGPSNPVPYNPNKPSSGVPYYGP